MLDSDIINDSDRTWDVTIPTAEEALADELIAALEAIDARWANADPDGDLARDGWSL